MVKITMGDACFIIAAVRETLVRETYIFFWEVENLNFAIKVIKTAYFHDSNNPIKFSLLFKKINTSINCM